VAGLQAAAEVAVGFEVVEEAPLSSIATFPDASWLSTE